MSKMYRFSDSPWKGGGDSITFIFAVNKSAEKRGKKIFDHPVGDVGDRNWCGEQRYVEEYKEAWVVGPLARMPDGWRIIARNKRAERHFDKVAGTLAPQGAT
jgi:hypothetical protein